MKYRVLIIDDMPCESLHIANLIKKHDMLRCWRLILWPLGRIQ